MQYASGQSDRSNAPRYARCIFHHNSGDAHHFAQFYIFQFERAAVVAREPQLCQFVSIARGHRPIFPLNQRKPAAAGYCFSIGKREPTNKWSVLSIMMCSAHKIIIHCWACGSGTLLLFQTHIERKWTVKRSVRCRRAYVLFGIWRRERPKTEKLKE